MAFLDEIGKTLTDKGREAAQKAREVAEVLQMKAQVSAEKSKARDLYAAIGKMYFDQHQEDVQEQYADTFTEIRNILANIAELEEKIRQLDGSKACPNCGAVMDKEAAFCSRCGTPMETAGQELSVVEEEAFEEGMQEETCVVEEDAEEKDAEEAAVEETAEEETVKVQDVFEEE